MVKLWKHSKYNPQFKQHIEALTLKEVCGLFLTSSVIFDFLFRVRDTSLCLTLFLFWLSMELICTNKHGHFVEHVTGLSVSNAQQSFKAHVGHLSYISPLLPPAAPAAPSCRSSCRGFRRFWSWRESFRCRRLAPTDFLAPGGLPWTSTPWSTLLMQPGGRDRIFKLEVMMKIVFPQILSYKVVDLQTQST